MATLLRALGLLAVVASSIAPYEASAFSLRRLEPMIPSLQACFIEDGYDYVGYDLTNVQGAVETCCDKCTFTGGCKAWSWSGHNGGTCWLKWGRGEVVVNPNVKSALLFFSAPQYCQLQNDLDYVDNDLARVDGTKAEDCCEKCQKYPGCRAYSWSDYQGGSCWLKSKVTQTVFKAGVKSAKAYPDFESTCPGLQFNLDYVDNDIDNKPASKPELCCDICKSVGGCRSFSWSGHNGGTCWLKSQKGAAVWAPGVVSAQILPNPPPCVYEPNTDYFDNDLDNKPGKDAEACCGICRSRSDCKAFSWSNFNGGTCWLKSAKGAPSNKAGVTSGTV